MKDKVLSLLGLCYVSKNLVYGGDNVIKEIKNNKVHLILMDKEYNTDASRQIKNKASFYNIEIIDKYNSDELSNALGLEKVYVIGILDKGFSGSIKKSIK